MILVNSPFLILLFMLLLLLIGAHGTTAGLLGFCCCCCCCCVKGEGKSAEKRVKGFWSLRWIKSRKHCFTCCLLLLRWRMTLEERMIEEDVERHSLFCIAAQQSKEKILKLRRSSNGNSRRGKRRKQINQKWHLLCLWRTHFGAKLAFFS